MKNWKFIPWVLLCVMTLTLGSCMKDDFLESQSEVAITLDKSNLVGEYTLSNLKVLFTETNSNGETSFEFPVEQAQAQTTLSYGTYTAVLEGDVTITQDGKSKDIKVRARQEGIVVNSANSSVDLALFLSDPSANFVIKELFFTGTVTPEGKQYNGDKYIILHNNSSEILYADGLIIAQSDFLTITKRDYTPSNMSEAFSSDEIFMVPGDGKQYPVAPGADFIIANNAIDHKEFNSNSFDLSKADLEIELIGSINVDNPQVPNAVNISGNLLMHNQGSKSYILGRLPEGMTADSFKEENAYTYSYIAANGREMKFDSFAIPNSYVIDAVNLSIKGEFEWIVTDQSLDIGWTYVSLFSGDKDRYNKSVVRKTTGNLLMDTNNSSKDFEISAVPSLSK